jgi:hypothetical protein
MDLWRRFLVLAAIGAVGLIVGGAIPGLRRYFPDFSGRTALAQAPHAESTAELEDFLFVQNPHVKGIKKGAIHVLWIPQPVQSSCLGKTAEQCSNIDYCIRTTNRQISICQNLGVDLTKLRTYPPNIRPRRLLSIIYFQIAPIKGWGALRTYFDSQSQNTLDRLSMNARIKARIKLIRSADDDDFELLEVLAVSPL